MKQKALRQKLKREFSLLCPTKRLFQDRLTLPQTMRQIVQKIHDKVRYMIRSFCNGQCYT